jgi:chemotaxis protein CheD
MDELKTYFLNPGYIFASQEPHLIHTVLGSCVAVCLWDSQHHCGGICHYILSKSDKWERSGKYGEVAIPHLIRLMLEMGSTKATLKAHIVGGGDNVNFHSRVGEENAELADKLLKKSQINVLTRDVEGQFGRKIIFNSGSGEILIYKINDIRSDDWYGSKELRNEKV